MRRRRRRKRNLKYHHADTSLPVLMMIPFHSIHTNWDCLVSTCTSREERTAQPTSHSLTTFCTYNKENTRGSLLM